MIPRTLHKTDRGSQKQVVLRWPDKFQFLIQKTYGPILARYFQILIKKQIVLNKTSFYFNNKNYLNAK